MPIYEYRCQQCGKTFEAIQKFSAEPFTTCGQSSVACENGGQGKVERLLGSPALQFKGSGFYITDYAKSGGGKKGANGDASKSETKSEKQTDSAPASSTKSDSSGSSASTSGAKD
jgi:putative FmdB family regulatory protein